MAKATEPPPAHNRWWEEPESKRQEALAAHMRWCSWRESPDRQAEKRLQMSEPLVAALEAGLFCFWPYRYGRRPTEMICIAVPRPSIRTAEGTQHGRSRLILHHADKPAVSWKNGTHYWYWQGIRVWREVAENPSRLTSRYIVNTRNAERRRVLLEHLGYDRFLASAGAEIVQQDDYGKLWRTNFEMDGQPVTVVEVTNATQEPDGSYRHYFLRVPPGTRTARAAVAWTFGYESRNYALEAQT